MIHLTLNTGDARIIGKIDDAEAVTAALLPIIHKRRGPIPGNTPWRTEIEIGEGWATFDIKRNRHDSATLNAVAWTPAGAASVWRSMERAYLASADQLAKLSVRMELEMPEPPTTVPWLVTWILPTAMAVAKPRDFEWMAGFERCLALNIINLQKS